MATACPATSVRRVLPRPGTERVILTFSDYLKPARALATELGVQCVEVSVHRFPDNELLLRLPESVAEHTLLYRSLDDPDSKLIELIWAAETAREAGAQRVSLIAPYLCYMRQDKSFRPGEAVSQRILARLLERYFDDLVTVDPHLHRVQSLQQLFERTRTRSLSATDEIAAYLAQHVEAPVIVGPDEESRQWVEAIAAPYGFDFLVAAKQRHGDRQVSIELPDFDCRARNTVIVDDMVSTGHTVAAIAHLLQQAGAGSIRLAVTHALFCDGAETLVESAGVQETWSADTLVHPSNRFAMAAALAAAVRSLMTEGG